MVLFDSWTKNSGITADLKPGKRYITWNTSLKWIHTRMNGIFSRFLLRNEIYLSGSKIIQNEKLLLAIRAVEKCQSSV